jgi:hypothetical protein
MLYTPDHHQWTSAHERAYQARQDRRRLVMLVCVFIFAAAVTGTILFLAIN